MDTTKARVTFHQKICSPEDPNCVNPCGPDTPLCSDGGGD